MNKRDIPKAKILRGTDGGFLGAYSYPFPEEYNFPSKHPIETEPLHASVASANDFTGIAVVQPEIESEAQSLADIGNFPVTAADGSVSDGR